MKLFMKLSQATIYRACLGSALLICLLSTALAEPEKTDLTLGFIKLTDCAPLVIAKEKGFFDEEGLNVSLEAQANWKVLLDRVISGELDGAHMLAGQPIAASVGIGTQANIITALSLDRNGNAITVSTDIWNRMKAASPQLSGPKPEHPISARALKPIVEEARDTGTPFQFGVVFPVSTHNYELRYWLAAGGIHPGFYTASDVNGNTDGDLIISVTPPPQMPATLVQGTIQGYCVGEPWNQAAVFRGIGVPIITDEQIWKDNPEKVFGVMADWAEKNPETHQAVLRALIRAAKWLDADPAHRKEASKILSRSEYVGADEAVIANSMTGTFEFEKGDRREMPNFNIFFRDFASYPYYSDCIWFLTQMRRWGQIPEPKPAEWYSEMAKRIYRPDIFLKAANSLVADGHLTASEVPTTDGYRPPDNGFIDGVTFDAKYPLEYLKQFPIGHQQ
jgi:nitrate/nitrite transport system substrate-binding protein